MSDLNHLAIEPLGIRTGPWSQPIQASRRPLLIEEWSPPPPPVRAIHPPTPIAQVMHFLNKGARAGVGGLVLLAHVLLGWIIVHQARPSDQSSRSIAPLTLIAIAPKAVPRISTDIAADLVEFTGIEMEQPLLSKKEPKEKAETIARSSGNTIAPRLRDSSIDAQPYARRAGLPPGTGATVVLRIEVFASGSVGQVKVDVSGGADSIDAAAIDYVRSLQWIGGRVDDQPATIWIRWGVRLDG